MSKQTDIYQKLAPVSLDIHKNLSVLTDGSYGYTRDLDSSPILITEFPDAGHDYSIVFINNNNKVVPIVLLSFKKDENLYLNDDGSWKVSHIPAYIRRYPYIFSSTDGKSFTLCIDETFAGCNTLGKGERLFDAKGKQTKYLEGVLNFLKQFQTHYQLTDTFTGKLVSLNLLDPIAIKITQGEGNTSNMGGFLSVNRDRLKQLPAEKIKELASTDELELIYIHLNSLRNIRKLFTAPEKSTTVRKKTVSKKKKTAKKTKASKKPKTNKKTKLTNQTKASKKTKTNKKAKATKKTKVSKKPKTNRKTKTSAKKTKKNKKSPAKKKKKSTARKKS